MIERNLRLVFTIANRYAKMGVNRMDLIQEGSLGLMRAVDRFDPSRGFKFSTYASWWIQQSIFLAIAHQSRVIRLPVHIHAMVNKSRKAKATFLAEHGYPPSDAEVAELLNMTPAKYSKMNRLTREAVSLDINRFEVRKLIVMPDPMIPTNHFFMSTHPTHHLSHTALHKGW